MFSDSWPSAFISRTARYDAAYPSKVMVRGADALAPDRFAEERLRRGDIAPGAETKVHGSALAIHGPLQIHPSASDLHIGFVDTPRTAARPCEPVPASLKLRRIVMHPAHDGGVGHRQAALRHHLRQVPEAELEPEVPPDTQHDDLAIKVTTLEQFVQSQEPGHRTARNPIRRPKDRGDDELHQSRTTPSSCRW